jgi:hypothetical protein
VCVLLRIAVRRSGEPRTAAIACVVAMLPSLYNTSVRPQSFSWLLLAVTLWLLERSEERPAVTLWIAPVMALWANLHGAFIVGLGFVAVEAVAAAWTRRKGGEGGRRAKILGDALGLSLIAVLANPWGWRVYGYVLDIGTDPTIRGSIDEWEPPAVTDPAGALFFISLGLVVAAVAVSRERLELRDLFRLGLGALLGLLAIRNGLWWTMAAAPPLATLLSPIGRRLTRADAEDRPRPINLVLAAILSLLVLFSLPWLRAVSPLVRSSNLSLIDNDTPVGAARFLTSHDFEGNMFNTQSFGSYLELTVPEHPTFIDSRIEIFTQDLWSDYADLISAAPGWEDIIEQREIGYAVLHTKPLSDLMVAMDESTRWSRVYSDKLSAVYVLSNPNK